MTDEVTAPAQGETTGGMFDSFVGGEAPKADTTVTTTEQTSQQAADTPWYSTFQDEGLREHLQVKGYKSPEALAKAHQSLEKMIGVPAEEVFRLRADMTDEDRNTIYSKLGRPEAADKYTLKAGEGDLPELVEWFKNEAFKSGMSDKAVNEFYGQFNEQVQAIANQQVEAIAQKNQSEMQDYLKSLGSKKDMTISLVNRAGEQLGLTEDFLESVKSSGNATEFFQIMAKVGALLGEGKTIEGAGEKGSMGMTIAEAHAKRSALQNDQSWMKAYLEKDSPTHKQAVQQMMDLNQIIINGR